MSFRATVVLFYRSPSCIIVKGDFNMSNFDFTQFVSFDSTLPYEIIRNYIEKLFLAQGFSIVEFKYVETQKKDYFADYWGKYSFELKKDDFLDDFMDWKIIEDVPKIVEKFVDNINEMLTLDIRNLSVIICSFAEKGKTYNDHACINKRNIFAELYKMSPFSFKCPNNLIISIVEGS